MRQKKKADADVQRREEKAAKEKAKQEREARSYNTVLQVHFAKNESLQTCSMIQSLPCSFYKTPAVPSNVNILHVTINPFDCSQVCLSGI